MTTNTNSAQERTASIDLAQLDAVTKRLYDALPASPNDAPDDSRELWYIHEDLRQLARRSLTSGAPAEPVGYVREDLKNGVWIELDESAIGRLPEGAAVYAAPVHDAAAPSDVQRCKDCGRTGWHVCRYSAGAAAKTEQVRDWIEDAQHENGNYQCLCSACGNTFIGHKRRVTCKSCADATAAGAGSAQPRAEGDERALFGFDRDDLEAVADGLESGYEKSIDIGGSPFEEGPNLAASTTAVAAKFIRAALDQGAQAATTASARGIKTWQERSGMREFIMPKDAAPHMVAEIRDLRAALARAPLPAPVAQPVDDARDAVDPTMLWDADDPEDGTHGDSPMDFARNYIVNSGIVGEVDVDVLCAYRGSRRTMRIVATEDEAVAWTWADAAMRANDSAAEGGKAAGA